jgi:hypothetical protein
MTTKKQLQRDVFNTAFESLGGITKLIQWCNESSDNYKEFIKLFVKLVPPVKSDSIETSTHESFIQTLMLEEKTRLNNVSKPIKLLEVTAINESQES